MRPPGQRRQPHAAGDNHPYQPRTIPCFLAAHDPPLTPLGQRITELTVLVDDGSVERRGQLVDAEPTGSC